MLIELTFPLRVDRIVDVYELINVATYFKYNIIKVKLLINRQGICLNTLNNMNNDIMILPKTNK